jgi:uncharacterized protein YbjT (DUF2867 family)
MILVAGATGVLGSEIVGRLRSRGKHVVALARATSAPEKVARLEAAGAHVVRGDLRNVSSLHGALLGVEAVICTVSMIVTAQPGDSFGDTDGAGARALIDAARRAGVRHFVYVSFEHERTPDSPLVQAKRSVEAHLRASGMTFTILHPGLFMESWLGPMLFADPVAGTAKIYGRGTDKLHYVAVGDVAEVAVQSLSNPAARNAIVSIGGPEAISQREALALFQETVGRPFAVSEIPEEALEAQWRDAADPVQRTFASLMLGVARGMGGAMPAASQGFDVRFTSVRDWMRQAAR